LNSDFVNVREDILTLYSGDNVNLDFVNNNYIGGHAEDSISVNAAPEYVNVKNDLFSGIN
jgi:hypothetical protein